MFKLGFATLFSSVLLAAEFGPGTIINVPRSGGVVLAGTTDFNRDGLFDIVTVSTVNNTVGIRISAVGGVDATHEIPLPAAGQPTDLLLADLNGDGSAEVVTLLVNGTTQASLCLINGSRTAQFTAAGATCSTIPTTPLQPNAALRLHAAKTAVTGLPTTTPFPPVDVVLVTDGPRGVLLPARLTGTPFGFNTPILTGRPIDSLALADLNGDGYSDAVYSSESIGLFEMNLTGLLRGSITNERINTTYWGPVALADIDLDTRPDVAVLDRITGSVRLFTASTTATLVPEYRELTPIPVSDLPATGRILFAADADRDGRPDFITRTATGLTLLRSGSARYQFETVRNMAPVVTAANLSSFSLAEINGDGQTDLLYVAGTAADATPAASNAILHTGRPSFTESLIELSAASVNMGTPVRFTARVLNASQTGGFGAIAGTVQFQANNLPIETVNLGPPTGNIDRQLGTATLERTLAPGLYEIKAVYTGAGSYQGSTSRTVALTVRGGTSELRINSLPPIVNRGDPLPLALEVVSAGAGNISGTITALLGTRTLTQAAVTAGRATLTLPTGDMPLGPSRVKLRFESAALPAAEIDANIFLSGRLTAVNAASYATFLAPDSIAVLQAPGLAVPQQTASALPWPTELSGVSVEVRDSAGARLPGRLYYAGPNQVNFLVPRGLAAGAGEVALIFTGSPAITSPVRILRSQPGIFTANGDGRGVPAALAVRVAADGTQTPIAVGVCTGIACQPIPIELRADEQVIVSLYGTAWRGANVITTTIGGQTADLLYGGGHPTIDGLDQINVRVPNSVRGEVDVIVTADGAQSNPVRLSFR